MLADDIRLDEIINFTEGDLNLQGRRLVLHDIHAFAELRKDLFNMIGPEQTRRILTRFGYYWGKADAAGMKRIFKWKNLTEWIKTGPRMHTLQGVTKTIIKTLEIDEKSRSFLMELTWHRSAEAEEHLIGLGQSDYPVCWKLSGYASGYTSYCFGSDIYFIEQKCKAKGDRICSVIGKDRKSWGKEIQSHLPFFELEDVQGKIEELSNELRKQTRKIAEQRRKIDKLSTQSKFSFVEIRSRSFNNMLELTNRIAPYDSSVLITGETGVGKEVLGRYIHSLSPRSKEPFHAINCAALPEALLESELFGHKAGSFTGAVHDRIGLLEEAQRGTVLLDEIGDISQALQVKLLRVLQEKEITRIGENKPRKIDIRIISATNRILSKLIKEENFREDFYYRLAVIEIEIPPLRERKEDILPLARYFVKQFSKKLKIPDLRLDVSCMDFIQAYSWPGNIRELENSIERAALLSQDGLIIPKNFPHRILESFSHSSLYSNFQKATLAEVEQQHIKNILNFTDDNQTKAAKILGIGQATLWRKLKLMASE